MSPFFTMFQRFSVFALLVCALFASSYVAQAKDSAAQAADRRAIVAAQARLDIARTRPDIPVIMSYIADDFHFYSIARLVQDHDAYERVQRSVSRFSQGKSSLSYMKTTVDKWQWRGPDALIYTTSRFGASAGRNRMNGLVHSREYWGKTARGWQLRQIVELAGSLSMNGETVKM